MSRRRFASKPRARSSSRRESLVSTVFGQTCTTGRRSPPPNGRTTTAVKHGALLDHTTRCPAPDRWYLAKDLASLRDALLRTLPG